MSCIKIHSKPVTHIWGFTDKGDAPEHGADGHLEGVAFAEIFCDAAELVHYQCVLKEFQVMQCYLQISTNDLRLL